MTTASIELLGTTPLLKTLGKLDDLLTTLAEPTGDITDVVLGIVKKYPPIPAGSTYIRTFRLQASWEREIILRGSVLFRVFSPSPEYNRLVMGRPTQTTKHAQTGWKTVETIVEDIGDEVAQTYDEFLQDMLE